ncbi:ankyrin repeat domain-containing protein [Paraburkholderia hayleyella]|uniref:ankyrin repeat domain-containing protein n=1 Tax=Paraburkholderia hayleyella TaxID=2152889 RepID=UPI001290DE0F|nr:ankyrin repeat domain-containing protein [Paraburkholderia hayleyella]
MQRRQATHPLTGAQAQDVITRTHQIGAEEEGKASLVPQLYLRKYGFQCVPENPADNDESGDSLNDSHKNHVTPTVIEPPKASHAPQTVKPIKCWHEVPGYTRKQDWITAYNLHQTVKFQRPDLLKQFLDHGANPNTVLPPYTALENMEPDGMGLPLDPDAEIDERSPLLHTALKTGNADILTLLLKWPNLCLNLKDRAGRSPLHVAIKYKNRMSDSTFTMLIRTLSKRKLGLVDQPDNKGNTPLHYAARNDDIRTVLTLLKKGATPWLRNKTHQTPLNLNYGSGIAEPADDLITAIRTRGMSAICTGEVSLLADAIYHNDVILQQILFSFGFVQEGKIHFPLAPLALMEIAIKLNEFQPLNNYLSFYPVKELHIQLQNLLTKIRPLLKISSAAKQIAFEKILAHIMLHAIVTIDQSQPDGLAYVTWLESYLKDSVYPEMYLELFKNPFNPDEAQPAPEMQWLKGNLMKKMEHAGHARAIREYMSERRLWTPPRLIALGIYTASVAASLHTTQ